MNLLLRNKLNLSNRFNLVRFDFFGQKPLQHNEITKFSHFHFRTTSFVQLLATPTSIPANDRAHYKAPTTIWHDVRVDVDH